MPTTHTRNVRGHQVKVTVSEKDGRYAASVDCPVGGKGCAHYGTHYRHTEKMAVDDATLKLSTHLSRTH